MARETSVIKIVTVGSYTFQLVTVSTDRGLRWEIRARKNNPAGKNGNACKLFVGPTYIYSPLHWRLTGPGEQEPHRPLNELDFVTKNEIDPQKSEGWEVEVRL